MDFVCFIFNNTSLSLKSICVGFVFIFCSAISFGQNLDCTAKLAQANDEFTAGRFFGISSLLQPCLENGFTTEQRFQAYYLLTQAYLILDDPIAAEDSYLKMLRADPEYVTDATKDPIDLVYLSKKFTATPIFTPHLRFGFNTSVARIIHPVTTEGYTTDLSKSLRPSIQFGGGIDWNYNDNLSIGAEATFALKSIKSTRVGISIDDVQEAIERHAWVDIPFYIKYRDNFGTIRPFGYAGFSLNLLLSASEELRTDNLSPVVQPTGERNPGVQVPTEGPNVNIGYKRNFLNRSVLFGGGVYYKVGHDFVFVDARYTMGLSNLAKVSKLYEDENGNFSQDIARYRWVGDLFRLDNISLSFGYVRPLYNPRKIKRAKTKKVLRDISKEDD